MPGRIVLTAIEGPLRGREFALHGKTLCVLGRGMDCTLRLPELDSSASRRHCLLDVAPPVCEVRDLGSLNGTFVNGEPVGRRRRGEPTGRRLHLDEPGYPLVEGDELRVGQTVFHVHVDSPVAGPRWARQPALALSGRR
jgi:serine/threonine-protein kinase